ncbi:MAG: hypothetical protein IPP27_18725 [Bacteroidetes bacterium]|nr:hypothetical protein [Bacteroidota bacterium]
MASVTVYVYVSCNYCVNEPSPVCNFNIPPVADTGTVADPPLRKIAVAEEVATTAVGSVTVPVVVDVHPLASLLCMNMPADTVNEPSPGYGAVPPVADTTTDVVPPLHRIVPAVDDATKAAGSVNVIDIDEVHPFASVTDVRISTGLLQ